MEEMCMLKKIILGLLLVSFAMPVFSEEINLTPKNSFSGFNNNGVRPKYPQFRQSVSAADIVEEENENSFMKPKSVKQMGSITPSNDGRAPMTYSQFPQNYDSSNSMMMMQGGMQNMFMGY